MECRQTTSNKQNLFAPPLSRCYAPTLVSYKGLRRVVVTGIGILSPVGNGKDRFFDSLAAGRSAIRRLSAPFTEKLSARIAAELEFDAGGSGGADLQE